MITGFQDVVDGKADTISGIETPDDKTIIFHLDTPAGDFLYRVAMPAVGPIPTEVTDCFTKAGDYGRYRDRVRPVHDRGLGPARHHELRHDEADLGLQPREVPAPRPQPELRPGDRLAGGAVELPGSFRVRDQLERGRHLRPGEGRDHRRGARRRDRQADQGVHGGRGSARTSSSSIPTTPTSTSR